MSVSQAWGNPPPGTSSLFPLHLLHQKTATIPTGVHARTRDRPRLPPLSTMSHEWTPKRLWQSHLPILMLSWAPAGYPGSAPPPGSLSATPKAELLSTAQDKQAASLLNVFPHSMPFYRIKPCPMTFFVTCFLSTWPPLPPLLSEPWVPHSLSPGHTELLTERSLQCPASPNSMITHTRSSTQNTHLPADHQSTWSSSFRTHMKDLPPPGSPPWSSRRGLYSPSSLSLT